MHKSRTYNSIINSFFGIAASAITVVLNFFVRVVLVRQLGVEINGLHTLFQSVINVMAIMEMGISSAMIIHLYEPIEKHDSFQIRGIMSFYKKIYRYLAIAFGAIAIFVSIFVLDNIVTTTINMKLVRTYFLLFGLSSVINYFTYYKRSILYAEQKNRISIGVNAGCELLFRSAQIVSMILLKEYIVFLILWIMEKLTSNTICSIYVNKNHPYLINNNDQLNSQKKKAIFATIKPLFVNQIAGTVRQSSNSILTSLLLGNVAIVGFYGNYQLVISMVEMVYSQFGGAITTSFGNLAVEGNKDRLRSAYKKSAFVMNWIGCLFCAGFFVCIQDFIVLVFTGKSILSLLSVISLLANLVFYLINVPIISIQNALGLHRLDAIAMIWQAVLSITFAYVGGLYFDMPGIFFGMLIPLVFFTTYRKGVIISENAMGMKQKEYLSFILFELLKMLTTIVVSGFICHYIHLNSIVIDLLTKGLIAILISLLVTPILSINSDELLACKEMAYRFLNRNKIERGS